MAADNVAKLQVLTDQLDPTGEVLLEDPSSVEAAIQRILDKIYGNLYRHDTLATAISDVVRAYRGEYPGLLHSDTLYHDLRHALETGLTAARLLDGHAQSIEANGGEPIDADHGLLCVMLSLFHDVGLLRNDNESHLWGPVLIPIHEERGVEFMRQYLSATELSHLADKSILIMPTKLIFTMPETWPPFDRTLASLIGTADLLSQFSDRCYLEKCRDFLFVEFCAFGLAGKADSAYPNQETLLSKTPDFLSWVIQTRLKGEFGSACRLLELHTGGASPWKERMESNQAFLRSILDKRDFSRLKRQPRRIN